MQQILLNIVNNAFAALSDGGRLELKVENLNGEKVKITSTDNGCGISESDIEHIFEPFFSTKANGTGLGLAVSYGIVENHQGDIRIFSELGKGTRFIIDFPFLINDRIGEGGHENS